MVQEKKMVGFGKSVAVLLLTLSMISGLTLTACGAVEQAANSAAESLAQLIEGDVTGTVGTEYRTMWFTFTVDSMETTQSYNDYAASDGNTLVIAHITETNNSGADQPFGTFDWFVDDTSLPEYIYPLDPLNDDMMPVEFTLSDGETASYDVVIEYPDNLANPYLMYIEADDEGQTYTTFKVPVK
jgi:hypothetical protein